VRELIGAGFTKGQSLSWAHSQIGWHLAAAPGSSTWQLAGVYHLRVVAEYKDILPSQRETTLGFYLHGKTIRLPKGGVQ